MKKHLLLATLGLVVAIGSSNALAHTALSEAMPADGANVAQSPEDLNLSFTEAVNLMKVTVTFNTEQEIDIGFVPSATAANVFAVPLPSLEDGRYQIDWIVLGSDSHRVEGKFAFTVDATTDPHVMPGRHADHSNTAPHAMPEHSTGHGNMPAVHDDALAQPHDH